MTDAQNQIIGLLKQIRAATGGAAGAAWGAITGTLSDQTDLQSALDLKQTEAQVNALIAVKVPYLVYTALFTPAFIDPPVVTVLQNTLGGTVVWTWNEAGSYTATLSGAFTLNKTVLVPPPAAEPNSGLYLFFNNLAQSDVNSLILKSYRYRIDTEELVMMDDIIQANSLVEIRVYP